MGLKKNVKNAVLIDGTAYQIQGGKTTVNGTSYKINQGRTKIDGTGYDIIFAKPCTLTLRNINQTTIQTPSGVRKFTVITIDGKSIDTSVTTHEAKVGQTVTIDHYINLGATHSFKVTYNTNTVMSLVGEEYTKLDGYYAYGYVLDIDGGWVSKTYTFVLQGDTTITWEGVTNSQSGISDYLFKITDNNMPQYTLTISGTIDKGKVKLVFSKLTDADLVQYYNTGTYTFPYDTQVTVYSSYDNYGVTGVYLNGTSVKSGYNSQVYYQFVPNDNITVNYGLNGNIAYITTSK